ncbi:MAG: hypothetical protein CVV24_10585 [Ignavibacteriae bacterium HGW-Ignavibacteriae-3]|nr:MAG: hypothetical protein CVV24_10585 [Ignavibacteriae bacterium HGW-Ignavibacteriae-3]
MKRIIIAFIALASSAVLAQSEQQSIELPDFVITGRQSINVPIAAKKKPDFIPTLSQDFFTPQFAPEDLPLFISSAPDPVTPNLNLTDNRNSSKLSIQLGKYSFPVGELQFSQSFENFLANAKIWGSNIKEYIPNAGYNNSGVSLMNDFFISTRSDFLPGSVIKLGGDYIRDSYKFFGSAVPTDLRETNRASGLFSISSSYSRWVSIGAGFSGNILSLNENGFKETNFAVSGLFEFKLNSFSLGTKVYYTRQLLQKNLSMVDNYNYFAMNGYVRLFSAGSFNLIGGINVASAGSQSFFSPFGSIEYRLVQGLTLGAEFNPHTKFFKVTDFLSQNLYFNPGLTDNVFLEYKTDFNAMIRYEYEKLFSVSLTGGYASMNNNYYFDDVITPGKLDLYILPKSDKLSGTISFFFYPTRLGYLIGDLNLSNVKDEAGNFIPYEPKSTLNLTYGYNFDFGIDFKIRYKMAQDIYTNITNTYKLDNYNNMSVSLGYEILSGLKLTADFQNVFNRTNFMWKLYREKPFDLLLGIEYHW